MTGRGQPGGQERPIPADAPGRQIGEYLRTLRYCADSPTYRRMAEVVGCATQNTLSRAASGSIPPWTTVAVLVRAVELCAETDHVDVHQAMRRHAAQFGVDPDLPLTTQAKLVYDRVCAGRPGPEETGDAIHSPAIPTTQADVHDADVCDHSTADLHRDVAPIDRRSLSSAPPEADSDPSGDEGEAVASDESPPLSATPPAVQSSGTSLTRTARARIVVAVAAVAFTVVMVVTSASGGLTRAWNSAVGGADRTLDAVDPGPGASPLLPTDPRPVGSTTLSELAAHVRQSAPPLPDARYAYIHFRMSTYETAPAVAEQPSVHEEQRWWPQEGDGLQITVITPPNSRPQPRQVQTWTPAKVGPDLQTPLSSDPTWAADQLTRRHPYTGAAGRIRAVGDFNRYQVLDPAQRAAVLDALAATPDVHVDDDRVADSKGRPGIVVSAETSGGVRETITVDPDTGKLLSHETAVLSTADRPVVDGVTTYTVFLELTRTDTIGA